MSREPLSLPTSLFIFKNLTCHGFWQTRWYSDKSLEQRQELLKTLIALMRDGKVWNLNDARISVSSRLSSFGTLTMKFSQLAGQRATSVRLERFVTF
jgi:trans-2-enoyl-CoA reductase